MSQVARNPISEVAVVSSERNAITSSTLDWFKDLLVQEGAKETIASMKASGYPVKLGSGAITGEQQTREVEQLLNVLSKIAPDARNTAKFRVANQIFSQFGANNLPSDLKVTSRMGQREFTRPRYDLGAMVRDNGTVAGLVFNGLIANPFGPVARGAGVSMERNEKGGLNIDLGPDVVGVQFLRNGRGFAQLSLREIVQKKVDSGRLDPAVAEQRLDELKDAGWDLNQKRSVLVAKLKGGGTQLIAFRGQGEDNTVPLSDQQVRELESRGFRDISRVPRDLGVACIDDCVVHGDLLPGSPPILARKPVINVYHPVAGTTVEIEVTLAKTAYFSSLYPKPAEVEGEQSVTWTMKSGGLSGELFDPKTERRYPYLYWEAMQNGSWKIDRTQAYCVRGVDSIEFLEKACQAFAFNAKETADFITYWITALEQNEYNVIQFMNTAEYDRFAHMEISPTPDQVTRVFMIFERSSVAVDVGSPALPQITRSSGYVVTEWGGSNLDEARRYVR